MTIGDHRGGVTCPSFSYGKHVPQYNHYSIFLTPHFDIFLLHHLCQFNHYYKVHLNFLVEIVHLSQINFKQAFKCLNHIFKTDPSSEDSHHLFPGPSWIRTCCHFTKHVWHVLNCDSIGMGNDLFLRWDISHSPPPPPPPLKIIRRLSLWSRCEESTCQWSRHKFDPWPGKIPSSSGQLSLWNTITEPMLLRAHAPQQGKPPPREAPALHLESSPCSPHLEKAQAVVRPSTAQNKYVFKKSLGRPRGMGWEGGGRRDQDGEHMM